MSTSPLLEDDSYVELLKLQKLFQASFSLGTSASCSNDAPRSSVTLEEAHSNTCVTTTVLLRPTDPEFDLSQLGGDSAIRLRLRLHRTSLASEAQTPSQDVGPPTAAPPSILPQGRKGTNEDNPPYTLRDACDIEIENASIPQDVKLVIKKVLLTFLSKYRPLQPYAVYECLKFLDREICRIFELCASRRAPPSNTTGQETSGAWSLEEQKSLEFALAKTKGITDPQQRWATVASVVKTKTAEECRRRFQRCRELLLNKATEERKAVTSLPEDYQTVLAHSESLRLVDLKLVKVSVFNVVSFVAQMVCTRCETPFDATFTHGEKKTIVISRSCDNCHMAQRCEFLPQIAFISQCIIGKLVLENCVYRDFISGEFFVTCEACGTQCKLREVQSGSLKNSNCRGCFAKLTLGFTSVDFGDDAPTTPPSAAAATKSRPPPIKTEHRKPPGVRGLKVGTPLPDNGACKHYKKSFRWFRFPCCGKLFPCDTCHDESSDHPYEQANIVVCGHCSTQQTVSNKKCRNCDKGYTASTSSYWEGGKGCRDATRLNRKDSKKYRLLRRQTEQAQGDQRDKASNTPRPRR